MSKEREVIEKKIAWLRGKIEEAEKDLDDIHSASRFNDYYLQRIRRFEDRLYDLQEILKEADARAES